MELLTGQALINKLKEAKQTKNLSVADIAKIIKENGGNLSVTTIKRVFAKKSDGLNFSHDYTLLPIAKALKIDISQSYDAEKIKGMNAIINAQKDDIERLRNKNQSLERDIQFLRDQIAHKDEVIRQLMEMFVKEK